MPTIAWIDNYLFVCTRRSSYTFIHLDNVDATGHSHGWCTSQYLDSIGNNYITCHSQYVRFSRGVRPTWPSTRTTISYLLGPCKLLHSWSSIKPGLVQRLVFTGSLVKYNLIQLKYNLNVLGRGINACEKYEVSLPWHKYMLLSCSKIDKHDLFLYNLNQNIRQLC